MTFPDGAATSQPAAEVKSSSPRRRFSGRCSQESAQLRPKRLACPWLAATSTAQQDREPSVEARTREDPAASDKATNADPRACRQPTRPPKPNPSGRDLDLRRRRPSLAPAHENPLSSRSAQLVFKPHPRRNLSRRHTPETPTKCSLCERVPDPHRHVISRR
jgi:hypothetical protein